jgi:hypothetical protein
VYRVDDGAGVFQADALAGPVRHATNCRSVRPKSCTAGTGGATRDAATASHDVVLDGILNQLGGRLHL